MMPCSVPVSDVRDGVGGQYVHRPFLIVEGSGVMLSQKITRAQLAVLNGLVEVVQRIGPSAPVRYLTQSDVAGVLSTLGVGYRASAENNQSASAVSQESSSHPREMAKSSAVNDKAAVSWIGKPRRPSVRSRV